jgi:hypothetical protein
MFFFLGFPLFLLGVGCIVLLFMLPAEGAKLGLPPEVLKKWRSARQMAYISGLVACWGSGFIGTFIYVVVSIVTTNCHDYGYGYGNYCEPNSGIGAFFMQFVVTLLVLGGAGAFAFMSFQKSQAIAAPYKTAKPAYGQPPAASGWGQPSAYPPPPPAPGQPGAYPPPPAGPGWGQPPAPPQPWNQPPAAAQPWNQPPAAAQPSNQPPAAAQPWNQPPAAPAAPADPAAPPVDPNTGAPKA